MGLHVTACVYSEYPGRAAGPGGGVGAGYSRLRLFLLLFGQGVRAYRELLVVYYTINCSTPIRASKYCSLDPSIDP